MLQAVKIELWTKASGPSLDPVADVAALHRLAHVVTGGL